MYKILIDNKDNIKNSDSIVYFEYLNTQIKKYTVNLLQR